MIPLVAAALITLWGWRVTTVLFAIPAIVIGLTMCAYLDDPRSAAEHHSPSQSHLSAWRHGLETAKKSHVRWILLATILAAGGSGHGVIVVYMPLYLTDTSRLPPSAVGFVFSLLMVGSIVGPLLGGRLVDRFSRQKVILGAYGVAALTTLGFPWIAGPIFLLPLSALLLGTAAFAVTPILQTFLGQTMSDRERDMAFALYYMRRASWPARSGRQLSAILRKGWASRRRLPSWPHRSYSRGCACWPPESMKRLRALSPRLMSMLRPGAAGYFALKQRRRISQKPSIVGMIDLRRRIG